MSGGHLSQTECGEITLCGYLLYDIPEMDATMEELEKVGFACH